MDIREVANKVKADTGLSMPKAHIEQVLASYHDLLSNELLAGNKVRLPSIGVIEVKTRQPRLYNIRGKEVQAPATKYLKMRTSNVIKSALNEV